MFTSKEIPYHQRMLVEEYERAIANLKNVTIDSNDYVKMLNTVERLHDLMDTKNPSSVSKDALLNVGANLLGIFMIIKHEHVNVVTSKALSFVIRSR